MDKIKCLFEKSLTNDDVFMVCATVDTGFEWQAIDEHREKISDTSETVRERGRIYFNLQWDQYEKVQEMRSIDNIFIVADVQTVNFHGTNKEADLELFKDVVHKHMKLNKGLDIWKRATGFMGELYPTLEEYNSAKERASVTKEKDKEKEEEKDKNKEKEEKKDKKEEKEKEEGKDKKEEEEKNKDKNKKEEEEKNKEEEEEKDKLEEEEKDKLEEEGKDKLEEEEKDKLEEEEKAKEKEEGKDKKEEEEKDKDKNKEEEEGKDKEREEKKDKEEEKEKEGEKDKGKEKELEITRGRKRGVDPSESKENDIVRYRVTCERSGEHTFESIDVACAIGGELQTKYHWLVDLSKYHLEVICKLTEQQLVTLLRVTHESKHRRNIVSFGPTTLRSTICYNLLRLANPKPGDIVIDPMCGSGSIPIEAALAFSHLCILCGDRNSKALERTKSNIDGSATKTRINPVRWMALNLPLKDSFVDVIVTDMPFGKRSGKKSDNERLYKKFLLELGRVVKLSSGRLVLLTHDKKSFNIALRAAGDMFQLMRTVSVKIGGLQVIAYVLKRTNVHFTSFKPRYYY